MAVLCGARERPGICSLERRTLPAELHPQPYFIFETRPCYVTPDQESLEFVMGLTQTGLEPRVLFQLPENWDSIL